ncbi:MAG TPA: hypothetical protein VJP85_14345 [Candidatus Baltobacteraceae bacterium]|nr:hypothetical protein [Candidatus Baltobacteraceae bacterium]
MLIDVETPGSTYDVFCRVLRARGPTLNLLFEQARISPQREGDTILRDSFAGAIVNVLYGMLRDYWTSLGARKEEWKHAGTRVSGYSIAQLLAAAAENSRRFEDWDREKPSLLAQRRSVKILCAVLDIPVKNVSKHRPFSGNICWAVLETVSHGGGYRGVETQVREFADALHNSRHD